MGSINSQGVYEYDVTDDEIGPVLLNRQSAALTNLFTGRANTVRVANVTQRAAALAAHGTPTANNPLIVFRADAGAGRELEYTTNGTVWRTVPGESPTPSNFFTPASGVSVVNGHVATSHLLTSIRLQLTGVTIGTGAQNVRIGNVSAALSPVGFTSWTGWPGGGLATGLISSGGEVSVRYSTTAVASGALYVSGTYISG